jgi:hypothetical protein
MLGLGTSCLPVLTGEESRGSQRQLKAPTNPSFLAFAFSSRPFLVNWTVIFVVAVTWNLIRGCMVSGLVMKFLLCKIPLLYCCVPLAGTEVLTLGNTHSYSIGRRSLSLLLLGLSFGVSMLVKFLLCTIPSLSLLPLLLCPLSGTETLTS